MTIEEARALLPDPCSLNRWLPAEHQGRKLQILLKWSKPRRRSYIWARYLAPCILKDHSGNEISRRDEWATYRETTAGKWRLVS